MKRIEKYFYRLSRESLKTACNTYNLNLSELFGSKKLMLRESRNDKKSGAIPKQSKPKIIKLTIEEVDDKDTEIYKKIRECKKLVDELYKYATSFEGRIVIHREGKYIGRKARIKYAYFDHVGSNVNIRVETRALRGDRYLDCKYDRYFRPLDSFELVKS